MQKEPGAPDTQARVTAETLARIGSSRVIASVSGGKDSTAMCLHLREVSIPYTAVFMDTGWENAETYRYLREELPGYIGEILWLRSAVTLPPDLEALATLYEVRLGHYSAMVRWCLQKAMFPSGQRRWCTSSLKVEPIARWLDALDEDAVSAVGIRAEESAARKAMTEWEEPGPDAIIKAPTWRPLIAWTMDDVVAIHHRHGVTPNRTYFDGARRVGCWPCIRANKDEIRRIADLDPGRMSLIRDLEADVRRLHHDRRGTEVNHSWFQARMADKDGRWPAWPIDRVVDWSRTSRGGSQIELFAAKDHEAGCMRWGMCDTGPGEGEP